MGIQERKYMSRDQQRKYADRYKLDGAKRKGPVKAPQGPDCRDYNDVAHPDININRPAPKYDEYTFDESDSIPNKPYYAVANQFPKYKQEEATASNVLTGLAVLVGGCGICLAWLVYIVR